MRSVSIAEANSRLAELIREAETGRPVRITRRGQAVAVLLAEPAYERLLLSARAGGDFAAWAAAWRSESPPGFEGITTDELARWRDV